MGLGFCCVGGCRVCICLLISVSLLVQFVLNSFSVCVNLLYFSDWSDVVVVFSICLIVQLNSGSQSIRSNGFMSSRSVTSIDLFFLILQLSASTVIFPLNLFSFLMTS